MLVCRAWRIGRRREANRDQRDTYVGLAAQVRLAPHQVSGATEAATVYEIVAGAQGRFSMVAQVGRHSTG